MFKAFNSTQPTTRDLYRQMFLIHEIPVPRPAEQSSQDMVTMETSTSTQVSTQGLYYCMFATHGIPIPHQPVQQPGGLDTIESNSNIQASTENLYREMFANYGRPVPVTFQGSAPGPASTQDLYHQMFTAHNDTCGTDTPDPVDAEPLSRPVSPPTQIHV